MREVWLVNPYGPIEGEQWREYSFNQFGKYLSDNGFKVIWWTSSYSHHFKKYRAKGWKDIEVNDNFIIRLVPTSSYKKNFGIGRLFKDFTFSKNTYARFNKSDKPDIILCSTNPLLFGYPEFKYAKKRSIPIIYDQMDLWPEFIESVIGKPLDKILHMLLLPVYKNRKKNYAQLDGAMALGKNYLIEMFKINPSLKSKPNALVYNGIDVTEFRQHLKEHITNERLPKMKKEDEIWSIFAGTLGPSYDIMTVIQCAEQFGNSHDGKYKFIIAGSGPFESKVMEAAESTSNLIYLGKLLPEELIPIYGMCDVGLAAYSTGSNVDMPDKFYDYIAANLVTISSLNGEIQEYLSKFNCGIHYEAGNAQSLYDAIIGLEDREVLNKMKENSKEVGMLFDKDIQNQKLLELINKIIPE